MSISIARSVANSLLGVAVLAGKVSKSDANYKLSPNVYTQLPRPVACGVRRVCELGAPPFLNVQGSAQTPVNARPSRTLYSACPQ